MSHGVHKATPTPGEVRGSHCFVCGQPVLTVPGGRGPVWVHGDTGMVAGPNPPQLDAQLHSEWIHERAMKQYPHDSVLAAVFEQGYRMALAEDTRLAE